MSASADSAQLPDRPPHLHRIAAGDSTVVDPDPGAGDDVRLAWQAVAVEKRPHGAQRQPFEGLAEVEAAVNGSKLSQHVR